MRVVVLFFISIFSFTSCISTKVYNTLDTKHQTLKKQYESLTDSVQKMISQHNKGNLYKKNLQVMYDQLRQEKIAIQQEQSIQEEKLQQLEEKYQNLQTLRTQQEHQGLEKNKTLFDQIDQYKVSVSSLRDSLSQSIKVNENQRKIYQDTLQRMRQRQNSLIATPPRILDTIYQELIADFKELLTNRQVSIFKKEKSIYLSIVPSEVYQKNDTILTVRSEGIEILEDIGDIVGYYYPKTMIDIYSNIPTKETQIIKYLQSNISQMINNIHILPQQYSDTDIDDKKINFIITVK